MASNMSPIFFLFLLALCLITIFDNVSACGGIHRHRRRHRPHIYYPTLDMRRRFHRSVQSYEDSNSNELTWGTPEHEEIKRLPTSCNSYLCDHVDDYPQQRINNGINKIRTILTSKDPAIASRREHIRPAVLDYKPNIDNNIFNSDSWIDVYDQGGCYISTNIIYPTEAYNHKDNRTYYVVNIPSFIQGVKNMVCASGNHCKATNKPCQQSYRTEELLVVPKKDGNIHLHDYMVKEFKVRDGCNCAYVSRWEE